MNSNVPPKSHVKKLHEISLNNLVLGILIKEKTPLLMLTLYLFINSGLIYWLSTLLIEKSSAGTFANPNIVLYFRLLIISSPLIIGLMFGAPLLSSEFESGTYRFLFTQGVGRRKLTAALIFVYFAAILLLSVLTIISVNHFLSLQHSDHFFTIWTFGVFVCQPLIYVPLSLAALIAGTLFGILMKRVVPGMAATLFFGGILAFGVQTLFDKLLGGPLQGLYDSTRNMPHHHYDFIGQNDPKYFSLMQILFASLLTALTVVLVFVSVRALDSRGLFHSRPKTSG